MMTVNGVNGPSSSAKPAVPPGIYVPTVTFFHDDEDQSLDLETLASHARFLIEAGVHGITINGTTGEFPLLTREERNAIVSRIARIRQDLKTVTTLVVGCSAQSTRETVQMCKDTKAAGGDYVLVLPPSYWAKAMGTVEVIASFYREVADKSPLPVIIYSFPAVTQGVDMDSDLLTSLARHPNIAGVKLTCGNVGKLTRLTHEFSPNEFSVFGGSTEWLVPGLVGKSCGAVTGLGNTHPRACVRLFELYQKGQLAEAVRLQGTVASAEWGMAKTGMSGTKYAVEVFNGYAESGRKILPRRPLLECSEKTKTWIANQMSELLKIERSLSLEHS